MLKPIVLLLIFILMVISIKHGKGTKELAGEVRHVCKDICK